MQRIKTLDMGDYLLDYLSESKLWDLKTEEPFLLSWEWEGNMNTQNYQRDTMLSALKMEEGPLSQGK